MVSFCASVCFLLGLDCDWASGVGCIGSGVGVGIGFTGIFSACKGSLSSLESVVTIGLSIFSNFSDFFTDKKEFLGNTNRLKKTIIRRFYFCPLK